MSLCIKGIGTAVPPHCIAQEDLAEVAGRFCGLNDKQRRMLPTLYRHAGVQKRHSVVLAGPSNRDAAGQSFYQSVEIGGPNGPSTADRMRVYAECATPLAADACRRALAAAQMEPEEITHLVTVSCSGFCAPGVDVQLFH
ncbi:MAG TPA: type III polyketide synthase, partial [Planctomycetaceae bacterium]|nr:type III polyketide synthase [Planctomycetaceae bacterium]